MMANGILSVTKAELTTIVNATRIHGSESTLFPTKPDQLNAILASTTKHRHFPGLATAIFSRFKPSLVRMQAYPGSAKCFWAVFRSGHNFADAVNIRQILRVHALKPHGLLVLCFVMGFTISCRDVMASASARRT